MTYRGIALFAGVFLLSGAHQAEAAYQQKLVLPFAGYEFEKTADQDSEPLRFMERPLQLNDKLSNKPSSDDALSTPSLKNTDAEQDFSVPAASYILTRAEFTAIIVEKLYTQAALDSCFWDIASSLPVDFTLVFTDVHVNDRFAKHICVAMRDGIVSGYADGSFRPDRPINFAESAKILSRAYVLAPYAHLDLSSPWYKQHVEALAVRKTIPENITRLDQLMTAADAAEILTRIANNVTWRPSRSYEDFLPKQRKAPVTAVPKKVSPAQPKQSSSAAAKQVSSKQVSSIASKQASSIRSIMSSAPSSAATTSNKSGLWNPF